LNLRAANSPHGAANRLAGGKRLKEKGLTGTTGVPSTARFRLPGMFRLALGLSLLAEVAPTATAAGDPVPLPRLAPAYSPAAHARAADATAAIARPQTAPAISANSRFNRNQQIALHHINEYFNSFRMMEGQFIQFGPNGEQSEGVFFLSRPGRIRFRYGPPARLDVIADGSSVAIRDNRNNTQDLYPLSKTPLRYLLADAIDLTSQDIVDAVREEADLIALIIVEKSTFVEGKLTLIFDRKTYELRQWVVTDAQGLDTSVAIYNVRIGRPQKAGLYRITVSAR
jgi:outer membrane lipoprotein-sorting protein